ncbi:transmembrane protein, putative [Medicago truncatula]|uniref:Transmembrane protein, putative n=1 Tax=Medicago truncatula TaxID=3880 RepID=A0A072UJ30_MEDTR|nr:transmembrane protein, putative [Medicago truncatula]
MAFNWGKKRSSNSYICLVKLCFHCLVFKKTKSGSWKKVLKVRVRALGLNETNPNVNVRGFMVMNRNLFVFATEEKLYSYGLEGESYMMVEEMCQHNYAFNTRFISYSIHFGLVGLMLELCLVRN